MQERIETVAAGLRILNREDYGAHAIPEEIIMERARNIVTALMIHDLLAEEEGEVNA